MEDSCNIVIDGEALASSGEESNKAFEQTEVQLQVAKEEASNVDDNDNYDDDDFGTTNDEQDAESYEKIKKDRMIREYVSLILNANDDPIKPGSKFTTPPLAGGSDTNSFGLNDLVEKQVGIHRMYENLGSYDDYLKQHSKQFVEITPNLVWKLSRNPGEGKHSQVTQDALVLYNYAFWFEGSKEPFESSWSRRTTMMVRLATDYILDGLRDLLLSCQQRELCEAIIRPKAAFGSLGVLPKIPANATIFCLIEVVRVVSQDQIAQLVGPSGGVVDSIMSNRQGGDSPISESPSMSFISIYEASDEYRFRGNYFSTRRQYAVALQRYKSAIRLLEGYKFKDSAEESTGKELLLKLYNNVARTSNSMGNPHVALLACKRANRINSNVPKTYWYRMSAWASKGRLERALGVARRALRLFPDPKVNKQFELAAEDFKNKLQQKNIAANNLHRMMDQTLVMSA